MRIPALALTVRTLRVDARSLARAWMRIALVGCLLLSLAWSIRHQALFGAPGLRFFSWLVHIDFWLITLLGVSAFSGVITEEKEQMTLGLLDLAGFDRISILLGKSVGQLVTAVLLLGVQLPFAVIAITMGGVSTHQVVSAYVLLGSWLVLVYGVALLASTVCHRSNSAATLTAFLVAAWLLMPVLVPDSLWGSSSGVNPYLALLVIAETGYEEPLASGAVSADLAIGACGMLAAWLLFRRFNQEEWRAGQARGWLVPQTGPRDRGRPRPGPAALAWKDYRFVFGGSFWLGARLVGYVLLFLVLFGYVISFASPSSAKSTAVGFLVWMFFPFILEYCRVASRFLHEEVKWQTLHSLVALPYPMRSWMWAKVRGSALVLLPITALMAVTLLVFLCTLDFGRETSYALLSVLYFGSVVWFAIHLAAWASLVLKRGALAVTAAGVVVSWMLSGLLLSTCMISGGPEVAVFILSVGYSAIAVGFHRLIYLKVAELGGK